MGTAGIATALITDANVTGKTVSDERLRGVTIQGASVSDALIEKADVWNSTVHDAQMRHATARDSYLKDVSVHDARLVDSRVEDAKLRGVALQDVTLCDVDVPGQRDAGGCWLVDGGRVMAGLMQDAPERAMPGESFDLRIHPMGAGSLTVRNDPAGATALGFDPTAAPSAVANLSLVDEDGNETRFALGEAVPLPDGEEVILRVEVARTGIIDGSTLGLVLDLDGHGLRAAMTTLDVLATQLAFAPPEMQAFAPFLADNVARLVVSVALDENGNVDRDLDVAYTVNVLDVNETAEIDVVGDRQHHAFLHGDSELFSETPFKYDNPTSEAAHHPATLELILRDMVGIEGITYGAANFYATHLVAQSPLATSIELTASATNADGERLEAGPYRIDLAELPDEPRSAATPFGPMGDPMFPGEGTLRVRLVDGDGQDVEAQDGWVLMVQETPESHQTEIHVSLAGEGSTYEMPLAASEPVGLPFGDFVPHEYLVCVHHDGQMSCANDGALVSIRDGETTQVDVDVG